MEFLGPILGVLVRGFDDDLFELDVVSLDDCGGWVCGFAGIGGDGIRIGKRADLRGIRGDGDRWITGSSIHVGSSQWMGSAADRFSWRAWDLPGLGDCGAVLGGGDELVGGVVLVFGMD